MTRLLPFTFISLLIILLSSCSSPRKTYTGYPAPERKRKTDWTLERENIRDLRDDILISAIKHVGRDYRYGGKHPRSGFDCSGFISYVFQENGVPVSGNSRNQSKLGIRKSKSQLQPGDLVFFGHDAKVTHVALVMSNKQGKLEVIHSTSSSGVRIDEINHSRYWRSLFLFGKDVLSEEYAYGAR